MNEEQDNDNSKIVFNGLSLRKQVLSLFDCNDDDDDRCDREKNFGEISETNVGIGYDKSKEKRKNEDLIFKKNFKKKKDKGSAFDGVAHELRTWNDNDDESNEDSELDKCSNRKRKMKVADMRLCVEVASANNEQVIRDPKTTRMKKKKNASKVTTGKSHHLSTDQPPEECSVDFGGNNCDSFELIKGNNTTDFETLADNETSNGDIMPNINTQGVKKSKRPKKRSKQKNRNKFLKQQAERLKSEESQQ